MHPTKYRLKAVNEITTNEQLHQYGLFKSVPLFLI
nr:MAG TPA: hypothetical protein [Bacteriophage sp.]